MISVEDVVLDLRPESKTRLLKALAAHAAWRTGCPAAEISSVLAAREKLGSTGLGQGVAIAHAKVRGLQRPYGAFARLAAPCPFEAIDDRDVDLVVLLLLPEASPQEHLNVLAKIARRLRDVEVPARLRQADDAATAYRLLTAQPPLKSSAAA
ncbi:phosphotransferase IIA-like nitrogen-regulatory protein PtsN [Aminobacter aminovorans]|uniref:Nitrogen regulatory protein n=1 Tax=Aminobacter aminovorans TaxID=83263 RepID=A0A380WII5_AMIAI|nr:phosphotransferase IIA-like nitrogen-regulatory protein PtsN [Aminobacter aminovorans]SUU87974.1 Nitrogen regulatory protein [Aminobacter aminovorans]